MSQMPAPPPLPADTHPVPGRHLWRLPQVTVRLHDVILGVALAVILVVAWVNSAEAAAVQSLYTHATSVHAPGPPRTYVLRGATGIIQEITLPAPQDDAAFSVTVAWTTHLSPGQSQTRYCTGTAYATLISLFACDGKPTYISITVTPGGITLTAPPAAPVAFTAVP